MALQRAVRYARRFFASRNRILRNLSGKRLKKDDYLEVFMLVKLARSFNTWTMRQLATGRLGQTVFEVAAAPSPDLHQGSYFEVLGQSALLVLRTGLEVEAQNEPGTVEWDVAALKMGLGSLPARATASMLVAGFECKAWVDPFGATAANTALGRVVRMRHPNNPLPVPTVGSVQPFAVFAMRPATAGAMHALRWAGIGYVDLSTSEPPGLWAYLANLTFSLKP